MARRSLLIAAMTSIAITVARSGHELPVYPSYYPHEIEITTVASERAADYLREDSSWEEGQAPMKKPEPLAQVRPAWLRRSGSYHPECRS